MKVLYVDDEGSAHKNFFYATKDRLDVASVKFLFDSESAVEYVENNKIDCAFLDVELPGADGISLAIKLRNIQPNIEVAFVTAHEEFAREAYRAKGRAYISKPYSSEEINEALDVIERLVHPSRMNANKNKDKELDKSQNIDFVEGDGKTTHIYAKTFGAFDFMIDGYPVHFRNAKAKELLAFLIHQMGGTATNAQIFFALWECQEYTNATSTYVRRTIRALKEELERLGILNILRVERNSISLDYKKVKCDSYEFFKGNKQAINMYNGEYMKQYAWGEDTIALLNRVIDNLKIENK